MKLNNIYKYYINYFKTFQRSKTSVINYIKIQTYSTKFKNIIDFNFIIKPEFISSFFKLMYYNFIYSYEQLLNMTCIDNLNLSNYNINKKRFCLVYILNSINSLSRIYISCYFGLNEIQKSISSIYKAATWLEREIYDLFGVYFVEHRDLRRILTDYGFKGFPLRKHFP